MTNVLHISTAVPSCVGTIVDNALALLCCIITCHNVLVHIIDLLILAGVMNYYDN